MQNLIVTLGRSGSVDAVSVAVAVAVVAAVGTIVSDIVLCLNEFGRREGKFVCLRVKLQIVYIRY